jgi:hypothetical protein
MVEQMEQEANSIKSQNLKLSWYTRGGVSYHDVMNMSSDDRRLIADMIKENLETTKTSKLPFF